MIIDQNTVRHNEKEGNNRTATEQKWKMTARVKWTKQRQWERGRGQREKGQERGRKGKGAAEDVNQWTCRKQHQKRGRERQNQEIEGDDGCMGKMNGLEDTVRRKGIISQQKVSTECIFKQNEKQDYGNFQIPKKIKSISVCARVQEKFTFETNEFWEGVKLRG